MVGKLIRNWPSSSTKSGTSQGLRGNVFARGFDEEVDREGHDVFDHLRDTHAVDVP
jgi:hypothetical protein